MYPTCSLHKQRQFLFPSSPPLESRTAELSFKSHRHGGPSVIKEICYGISLGVFAGLLWKMHHWNNQRRTKEFYDMLEKGQISVVVEDD